MPISHFCDFNVVCSSVLVRLVRFRKFVKKILCDAIITYFPFFHFPFSTWPAKCVKSACPAECVKSTCPAECVKSTCPTECVKSTCPAEYVKSTCPAECVKSTCPAECVKSTCPAPRRRLSLWRHSKSWYASVQAASFSITYLRVIELYVFIGFSHVSVFM